VSLPSNKNFVVIEGIEPGRTVLIQTTSLEKPGYVTLVSGNELIGFSDLLSAGENSNISISLNRHVTGNESVNVAIYADDGDGTFVANGSDALVYEEFVYGIEGGSAPGYPGVSDDDDNEDIAPLPPIPKPTGPAPATPGIMTGAGKIICLPHRRGGIATTLECAYGLQGNDGYRYALTNLPQDPLIAGQIGIADSFTATGYFTPSDGTKIYDIIGAINLGGDAPYPTPKQPTIKNDCVVAGCSGTICTDEEPELMTTCEWKPEYACYQSATCEKQSDGQCGWTETPELNRCLAIPPDEE
jgi:eight-cysteine-cluster-containing protein